MKQWNIDCRITKTAHVTVEAETSDEAQEKFDQMQWVDCQLDETIDWEATDDPEEDE